MVDGSEAGSDHEGMLRRLIRERQIDAEHLSLGVSCHSVVEAAQAVQGEPTDFVKNICMVGEQGELIVAIVGGDDRASRSRVGRALGMARPRLATAEEIESLTGFPCGGTPSFGFAARFLIDPKVMEKEMVYSGGGSELSLVRISPREMVRANDGEIVRVRK